jgi:outer membrane protein OmpA-like peptidoglycan-associated protein
MKKLAIAIASALISQAAVAQQSSSDTPNGTFARDNSIPLTYVGSNARVGVSINDDGDFSGEGLGILRYTGTSALYTEGWIGRGGAAGLELGLNWLVGAKTLDEVIEDPSKVWVAKGFLAVDRNEESDRKATLGFGGEKNDLSLGVYYSKGLSDERFIGSRRTSVVDQITGTLNGRPTTQARTTTTIFDAYQKAYDNSYGARLGKYFPENLWRLRGGLDFAKGDFSSDQLTTSIGVDKYFENTPHSLSLDLAHFSRDGDFVADESDTQAALTYRYNFGQPYRTAAWEASMTQSLGEQPARADTPKSERVAVENRVDLDTDAFFDFDKSGIRSETKAELDRIVDIIKSSKLAGPIMVVGHTCSMGTDAYNIGLSNRRANAVEDYLRAAGIEAEIKAEGQGEANPSFPNDTRENRKKNRRVDVTFITIEEKFEEREIKGDEGPVQITKQKITVPPGWIERALRTPSEHRRSVDAYDYTLTRTETSLAAPVFVNRGPIAVNDTFSVRRNAGATLLTVLANDSDPDGDNLTVTSTVSTPANGTARSVGNAISYTPNANFVGEDTFTYQITDGTLTATATVRVTVSDQAPAAVDDAATVNRSGSVTVMPLSNDSDPEGTTLRVTGIDQPARGTAVLEGNNVRYTAPADFVGVAVIPYRIVDGAGNTAAARINITVANRAPVAVADTAATSSGGPVTINPLTNDTDADGDTLTLTAVSTPANGTARIVGTTVVYTPNAGFSGTDTFTYTISDGFGGTATGAITVTVAGNRAPTANTDTVNIVKGQTIDINVLANDTDPENDALSVVSVSPAAQGNVSLNANGTVRYAHRPGSQGIDTFEYVIRDAAGNTATGRISVRVTNIIVPGN